MLHESDIVDLSKKDYTILNKEKDYFLFYNIISDLNFGNSFSQAKLYMCNVKIVLYARLY